MSAPTPSCGFCGAFDAPPWSTLFAAPALGTAQICVRCVTDFADQQARTRASAARRPLYRGAVAGLLAELETRVVGQAAARRAFAAALFEHAQRLDVVDAGRSPRVLLVGPPGSGKTTLLRAGVELSAWPAAWSDLSRLSEAGLPGESIEMAVGHLFRAASSHPVQGARGALFLDGLDLRDTERAARIERELVRLLDGSPADVSMSTRGGASERHEIPTKDVLVVVAATASLPASAFREGDAARNALRSLGVLDPFLARFDRVVALAPLARDELATLLRVELASASRTTRANLALTEEALLPMAARAHEEGDGGWAVRRLLAERTTAVLMGDELQQGGA